MFYWKYHSKGLLFFLLFFSMVKYLQAQINREESLRHEEEAFQEQYQRAKAELGFWEVFTQRFTKTNALEYHRSNTCEYVIPVVIHAFHRLGALGVTSAQINTAMEKLNDDFNARNADFETVRPAFANVKSGLNIRFELAKVDPQGNPSTGIVYYQDMEEGFGGTAVNDEISSIAWDNYKYLNIYLMLDLFSDNDEYNSGVAWYPETWMSDQGLARIVYNWKYFGTGGTSVASDDFQSYITHEVGHYLNLKHTFEGLNCNGEGDNVEDTPPSNMPGKGCNISPCGVLINGENYMDYNDCHKNFTKGQVLRMKAALEHPTRRPLWQPENLIATGLLAPSAALQNCSGSFLSFSKTKLDESERNDGGMENAFIKIVLLGSKFTVANQLLEPNRHYTLSRLPSGLSSELFVNSDGQSAELRLKGKALDHSAAYSVTNLVLAFKNTAFQNNDAASIRNSIQTVSVRFKDPWAHTCADNLNGVSVNESTSWKPWKVSGPVPRRFGLWHNNSRFYVETYGRAMICDGKTTNITLLAAGDIIDASSNWVVGDGGGKQHLIMSTTYTTWGQKTGYAGFRMQIGNDYYYGWMKLQVAANEVKLLAWHYNNRPNAPIVVGSACGAELATSTTMAENNLLTVNVAPNPSTDRFQVQIQNATAGHGQLKLRLINAFGAKVLEQNFVRVQNELQTEMDLSNYPSGIYYLILEGAFGSKVVKLCKV